MIARVIIGAAIVGVIILARKAGPKFNLVCSPAGTTKAIEFRTGLEGNYRENFSLLLAASRRVYDTDPHAQDALNALDDNAWDLGYFLQNVYGTDVGQKFTALWQTQNKAFLNYTRALKSRDNAAKSLAQTEIQNYIESKVEFWKGLVPHLDVARYRRMVTGRSDSIKSALDAYAAGDVAKSYKEQHAAYQQTGQVAEMLSEIIIKELPEKFGQ